MNKKLKIFGLIILFATTNIAYGQTDKEKALSKGTEAIKLMDKGKIKESIKLLKEAEKLDPEMFDYKYEMAYAHYIDKDYKGAIKILEKNKNHKDVNERLFQLLGNSYDIIGKTEKAFEAYDEGLKIFPNSGMIYLEKGNVYWNKKNYDEALPFYEKGIEVDPSFPSNYYRATLLYCSSSEEVWGMIYGEIFMNLERNSRRTSEISKLLYDTYKSQIKFTSDTSFSVSFSKNAQININDLSNTDNIKLPFGIGVYEPTLMMSIINEKSIDLNSLDKIRTNFVETYFKNGNDKKYPNILFDYQNKVLKAGHLEAYNHWILMKGDEDTFDKWYSKNKVKWETFIEWFTNNGLKLDKEHKFYTGQY
jgi:tetratricopeptide (TPR) repeat protein